MYESAILLDGIFKGMFRLFDIPHFPVYKSCFFFNFRWCVLSTGVTCVWNKFGTWWLRVARARKGARVLRDVSAHEGTQLYGLNG